MTFQRKHLKSLKENIFKAFERKWAQYVRRRATMSAANCMGDFLVEGGFLGGWNTFEFGSFPFSNWTWNFKVSSWNIFIILKYRCFPASLFNYRSEPLDWYLHPFVVDNVQSHQTETCIPASKRFKSPGKLGSTLLGGGDSQSGSFSPFLLFISAKSGQLCGRW